MTASADKTTEDDRTTPIGLFNYAHSYWKSASELQNVKIANVTHPEAPVYFLYVHAIELFLKAYLRLSKTVQELKNVSHRVEDLQLACADLFSDADPTHKGTIDMIKQHKINTQSRYIYTGAKNSYPEPTHLEQLCNFLYNTIEPKMISAGYPAK